MLLENKILLHRRVGKQAFALPVLADERDSAGDRLGGVPEGGPARTAGDRQPARNPRPRDPEERRDERRAPRPHEPGDPEDFAAADLERYAVQDSPSGPCGILDAPLLDGE